MKVFRRAQYVAVCVLALNGPLHAQAQTAPPARTPAAEMIAEGEKLGRQPATRREALTKFTAALDIAKSLQDKRSEALALTRIGQTQLQLDNFADGLHHLDLAVPAWRAAGDRFQEALAEHNAASALWSMGDSPAALPKFESVLATRREIKDRIGEAYTLRGISNCYWSMGEAAEALDAAREALAIRIELKDSRGEAEARNALGLLYALLGDPGRARAEFMQSFGVWQKAGDKVQLAFVQTNLGWTAVGLKQFQEAQQYLAPAVAVFQETKNRFAEAYALHNLGNAYAGLNQNDKAVECFEKSLSIKQELNDRWGENYALHALGETRIAAGDEAGGLELLQKALAGRRAVSDRTGLILTLGSLARIHRDQGDRATAEAEIREAIHEIESSRSRLVSQDLRASFFASHRDYYEFLIDLLASSNRAAEALEAAEQSRGRMLLDRLADVLAQVRKGVDTRKQQAAQRKVNALADRIERLAATKANPAQEAKLKRDLEAAIAESRDAAESVRKASPRYADLMEPQRLTVPDMQKLLRPGEVLLSFALGREHCYRWTLTSTTLRMQTLGPRARIEAAITALGRSVTNPKSTDWQTAAAALDRQLIGAMPVPANVTRVIVAAEGALETVPFVVLPSLGSTSRDVAYLPSASALALLRAQPQTRPSSVLAIADPVLSPEDPRMPARTAEHPAMPADDLKLPRLRFSRLEADAIDTLGTQQTRKAVDFEAARQLLVGASIRNFGIVHLATHAILDPIRPDLSKVILSAFDSRGKSVEPSVRLHEIYTLDLRARLVTLSACRSATGASLPGEGLVSLTRGFQYAGAASVLATLWDVEDRSTAKWMEEFYRSLLVKKQSAATSVRSAILALKQNPSWSHPYYWAGFVLQGEWR
jgi:CHAT domain-containing protein